MTGPPPAADAFKSGLQTELNAAIRQAQGAGSNAEAVLAALDRLTATVRALDEARSLLASETRILIAKALRLGVDPRDLYGRPFSSTIVRDIATREVGITFDRRGPRPRTKPTQ